MKNEKTVEFINACDEVINCKYLVAEYKIQKMLKALACADEVCSLVGECLEQFNRDREFAKAYIQDGHGDFIYISPRDEYKIIGLVFCTLVDIDGKKIDFVDFIKRFFGREENPFQAFIDEMIVPFRNLIAEAFGIDGYAGEESQEASVEGVEENEECEEGHCDEEEYEEDQDEFEKAQKIAVQILSQLEFSKQESTEQAMQVCRAIVKTSTMQDYDVMQSLAYALKCCKEKQAKYLIKELVDLFD